jgi:Tol biopolymer transport system component
MASPATPERSLSADPSAAAGPWIAFQTDVGAGNVIHLVRRDGSDPHPLAPGVAGEQVHPDWSPDGRRIAFAGDGGLWTVDVDGSRAARLLACACDYPAWSPDGARIAFTEYAGAAKPGDAPASSSIRIIDLASGRVRTIHTERRPLLVDVPRWSPDGTTLAVGVDRMDAEGFETGSAIAILASAGGPLRYLTQFATFAYDPDWSRSTNTLVYSTAMKGLKKLPDPGDETWNLHVIESDGSDDHPLTDVAHGERVWQPTWTPDGRFVICGVEASREGALVDAATGEIEVLERLPPVVTHPRIQPVP